MLEAIILAGGFGTRLREAVPDLPKPMAPVAGRPFLDILLGNLSKHGFSRIILSVGYMAEKIIMHYGNQFSNLTLTYVVDPQPLGTGGAIQAALACAQADHCFIFNGDTFIDLETDKVEDHWRKNHNPIIIGRQLDDAARYGRLNVHGGRLVGFSEKSGSGPGIVNAGCYVLPRDIFGQRNMGEVFSMEADFLPEAVRRSHIDVFLTDGLFIDIGIPEDLARAQNELAGYCL